MVNYNNDTTISTPPGDILKVAILERRAYFINGIEEYLKAKNRGSDPSLHFVYAGLYSLFLELQDSMENGMKKEEFDALKIKVTDPQSYTEALAQYSIMSAFMYR